MPSGGFRPYATPSQVPGGPESFRSSAFRSGANGDPDSAATVTTRPDTGLTSDSMQWTARAGGGYRPSSVLTPIGSNNNPGGLGMSAGDAAKRLPDGTFLGTGNGMSESSFEPAALLKLSAGLDSQ